MTSFNTLSPPANPLVSLAELAQIFGRSPVTIRRWAKRKGFPAPFPAGKLQWLRADLEARGILRPDQNV